MNSAENERSRRSAHKNALRLLSPGALNFVERFPSRDAAYDAMARADWMLAMVALQGAPRNQVALACCAIVRLAATYCPRFPGLECVEITEKCCRGEVSLEQLSEARSRNKNSAGRKISWNDDSDGDASRIVDAMHAKEWSETCAITSVDRAADIALGQTFSHAAFAAWNAMSALSQAVYWGQAAQHIRGQTEFNDLGELPEADHFKPLVSDFERKSQEIVRAYFPELPENVAGPI